MLSGRQLQGLTVYAHDKKKTLGRVTDVAADPVTGQIQGLVVSSSSLVARTCYLPAAGIAALTLGGVVVSGPETLLRCKAPEGALSLSGLAGQRIQDAQGRELGVVADYLCDGQKLRGLELSRGLAADIRHGREFLDWRDINDNTFTAFLT